MTPPPDPASAPSKDDVALFAYKVAMVRSGVMTAAMIHLGDRLGLYRALTAAGRPITSTELAESTGLVERWIREWLFSQAAAGLVEADDQEQFSMSPAGIGVLADESSDLFLAGMFQPLPQLMQRLDALPESFRTGLGYDYDEHGPNVAVSIERSFEPWMRSHLVADALPLLTGMVDRLQAGTTVADIGCGAGGVVLEIAAAFPASRVAGYEISRHALDRARTRLAERGLANAEFHDSNEKPIPTDGSVGLVTTFDCLHDMTDPAGMARTIRRSLADDGSWLLVDIKAYDTYAENVTRNPMAAMMYGDSVLSCMSSGLSEPGGAGLGTLGLSAQRAEAIAVDAGFSRFRRLEVEHPVNAFYEIRP